MTILNTVDAVDTLDIVGAIGTVCIFYANTVNC